MHLTSVVLNSFNVVHNVLKSCSKLVDFVALANGGLTSLVGFHTLFTKAVLRLTKFVIKAGIHVALLVEAALDIIQ